MTSVPEHSQISAVEMQMLERTLRDIGFDAGMILHQRGLHTRASNSALALFRNGMTDQEDLRRELLFRFTIQKRSEVRDWMPLPKYAIQGNPPLANARKKPH